MEALEGEVVQDIVPVNIWERRADEVPQDDDAEIEIHMAMPDMGEWCEIKERGLTFKPDTPFDVWSNVTKRLIRVGTGIQWLIGDALRFGERRYGEMYAQLFDDKKYDKETLYQMKWVSEKVESSRRLEQLSWSHHHEVASLPPIKQNELLQRAAEERLTTRQLRKEVFEEKREITGEAPLWALVIDDPAWLQFAGSDGQEEWSVDVERVGPVLLSVNGESVTFLDIDAALRRLYALRDLAKKHFGANWPRG